MYQEIKETIQQLPQTWTLTPNHGKKAYRPGWQTENLDRKTVYQAIKKGDRITSRSGKKLTIYPTGFGLKAGNASQGLLAIDCDGAKAIPKLNSLGEIPRTVSWTSGKPGRFQLLFQIPTEIQPILSNFVREVIKCDEDLLEFRYNKCQSTLPPSYHPDTGQYKWINAPWKTEVAIAPKWLCEFLINIEEEKIKEKNKKETKRKEEIERRKRLREQAPFINNDFSLEDIITESVQRLGTDAYDWTGHEFIERGTTLQGCCPNHASESRRSFHVNTETLEWFCHGCQVGGHVLQYKRFVESGQVDYPTGKDFIEAVKAIAKDANVEFPLRKQIPAEAPDKKAYQEYLEWETEEAKIEQAIAYQEFLDELKANSIFKKISKTKTPTTKGYVIKYGETPLPTEYNDLKGEKIIEFKQGERIAVINDLKRKGIKYILDSSNCGTGKSHNMGELENPEEGKIWLCSKEHRNATVEPIERKYRDLPTRHKGLIRDTERKTALGHSFLRNVKKDQTPDVPSLCKNAQLFWTLNKKGYNPNEKEERTNPICANCIHFQEVVTTKNKGVVPKCAGATTGDGFGYLYERSKAIQEKKIRCSIDSLPNEKAHNYKKDWILIDEAESILRGTKTITAKLKDIDQTLLQIAKEKPSAFKNISEIIEKIYPYLNNQKKTPYYGLDKEEILNLYNHRVNLDEEIKIAEEVKQDIKEIITNCIKQAENYVQQSTSHKSQKKELIKEEDRITSEAIENLENNWLSWFLKILNGDINGSIRINNSKLIIDIPDHSHAQKIKTASLVYMADATADKEHLAKILQIESNEIIEIRIREPEWKNLTIYNFNLKGLKTNRPSDKAIKNRDKALLGIEKKLGIEPHSTPIISHKSEENHYSFFIDSRGTNQFSGIKHLAISGEPRINYGDFKAEYLTLYSTTENIQTKYQQKTEKEIHQTISRQRVHLYPKEEFKIFYLGTETNLSFLESYKAKIINLEGKDADIDCACDIKKAYRHHLVETIIKLHEKGIKITQEAIAQQLNKTQSWISQFAKTNKRKWMEWKKILVTLIERNNSFTNIFSEAEVIEFIEDDPMFMVADVTYCLINHGWEGLIDYLADFSVYSKCKILGLLSQLFLTESEKNYIIPQPPT